MIDKQNNLSEMERSPAMRREERQSRIIDYVESAGYMSHADGMRLFNASPATIRRDFSELADAGRAERMRGGLRKAASSSGMMTPFSLREIQFSKEKEAMAKAAAVLLQPGDVIIVDGGTSTFHLAQQLPDFRLRIITNSVRLAVYLDEKYSSRETLEVFLTGGYFYPKSYMLTGPQAKASLSQYHAKWAFLSAGGVNERGVSNNNEFAVECEKVMIENSEHVAILADHSKIGRQAMCQVCPLEKVSFLITDRHPDSEAKLKAFEAAGLKTILAG